MRALRTGVAMALLATGLACSDDATGPADPREYLGASVSAGPANVLSAEVTVRAAGWDSAAVRYWSTGDAGRTTPAYAFGADSTAFVSVLGLRPESTYEAEVQLIGDGVSRADTVEIGTGALPSWLPAVTPIGTDTTPGFLVLSLPEGPVIVDNLGRVVWYVDDPDPTLVNFQAHPNGEFTIMGLADDPREYRVLDELGRQTRTIACAGFATRQHEVRVLADGSALALCDDTTIEDLSADGGSATAQVTWTVIQRLRPDGSLAWQWHGTDHVDPTDFVGALDGVEILNLMHGNAVEVDVDGDLLASFRNLNEIMKLDATTGEVLWRFGGRRNEFTFLDDPKGAFQRQHGLRLVEPGVIQFLDDSDAPPSRRVRFELDEGAHTARLLWEYIDGPEVHTLVGGNSEVYADGGGLVAFGRAGRVVEVDPLGAKRWELTGIEGAYVFRAQRIPSLYAAERTAEP